MFSLKEKQLIAATIEEALLALDHPEMPKERPVFKLHVEGKEPWSWADIAPNWVFEDKPAETSAWNENARELLKNG